MRPQGRAMDTLLDIELRESCTEILLHGRATVLIKLTQVLRMTKGSRTADLVDDGGPSRGIVCSAVESEQ
jgi:hypothetical protein